jgi:hypothetical protein
MLVKKTNTRHNTTRNSKDLTATSNAYQSKTERKRHPSDIASATSYQLYFRYAIINVNKNQKELKLQLTDQHWTKTRIL